VHHRRRSAPSVLADRAARFFDLVLGRPRQPQYWLMPDAFCAILKTMWSRFLPFSALFLAGICLCQQSSTAWKQSELIEPSALADALKTSTPPYVICVAFPVLYRSKHIAHAIYAGPGEKPEGISLLKAAASALPKNEPVVIYCGCCPMDKCPNVRPAYDALKAMGFTKVRVLDVPTSMHVDWFSRGYPAEDGEKH
jgi:thiosulfate/3-mercaptopyruvate sulfurtransferase